MALLASPVPRPNLLTSGYEAPRGTRRHGGLDFRVPTGTPVFAMYAGKVISAKDHSPDAAGRMVVLEHETPLGKVQSRYLHLAAWNVVPGELVKQGQRIATSGSSGAKSPHLHVDVLAPPDVAEKARPHLRYSGAFVEHGDRVKVPLESLVPIDATPEGPAPARRNFGGDVAWLILLWLLFSES